MLRPDLECLHTQSAVRGCFLYESFYKVLNYFHCSLWADLEDSIPSQPVAVILLYPYPFRREGVEREQKLLNLDKWFSQLVRKDNGIGF